jgi:hypothetical protein
LYDSVPEPATGLLTLGFVALMLPLRRRLG